MKINFRYLKDTVDFGLWYKKGGDSMLKAYSNADWAGSVDDRKSTSGNDFFLGDRLVSWLNKKQDLVFISNVEEKYIVVASCCT